MSDKVKVELELSPRAALLLKTINDVYIKTGGPAYECAQDWEEEFTPAELGELSGELDLALPDVSGAPKP